MAALDEKIDTTVVLERVESEDSLEKAIEAEHGGLDETDLPDYHDRETTRILRKVDYRLVPMLTVLYLLAFLDRGNIGNAKLVGMTKTLGMSGKQYNMALTVFFFPYAIFEVPSNVVPKLIRPSAHRPGSWHRQGSCSALVSDDFVALNDLVKTYDQLLVTRIFLDLTEFGFFPAATYLLTTWYCRFEVQTRLAVFFSAASLAGAFSGILAFGIEKMEGVAGLEGWRWIFILEGIITARSPGDVNMHDGFTWHHLREALTEWKIYLAVTIYWGNAVCIYGFTYSAPSIIKDLGYETWQAQLLTVPIYVLGAISTIFFSWLSDKHHTRWPFIVGPYSVSLCGFIALLSIPRPKYPGLTYAFLFVIPAGVYPPLITILTSVGNNVAPTCKHAIGMALLISIGNMGGAVGCHIYLLAQEPHYWLGFGLCLGVLVTAVSSTMVLRVAYLNVNKKRDAMSEDEIKARYTEAELLDMGDKSPFYRYVV